MTADEEGAGAVDRVDDEDAVAIEPRVAVGGLLRQPAVVRTLAQEKLAEPLVDGEVGLAHRRAALLLPDLRVAAKIAEREQRRLFARPPQQGEVGGERSVIHSDHRPAMVRPSTATVGALTEKR